MAAVREVDDDVDNDTLLGGSGGGGGGGGGEGGRPAAPYRSARPSTAAPRVRLSGGEPVAPPPLPPPSPRAAAAPPPSLEAATEEAEHESAELVAKLSEVFAERERQRASRATPPAFICPITFDVMVDPVISPSGGHSYERAAITKYVTEVKAEDPQTRRPLRAGDLIPNVALKHAIQEWLVAHPWAHPYLPLDRRDAST